jgi:hypothetical protein
MTIAPLSASPMQLSPSPAGQTGAAAQASAQTATPQAMAATAEAPGLAALQSVLAVARQSAASSQDGLAVLMANVLRATATGNLGLHLSTDKTPDADAVKNAMASSGLFTEATLAAGAEPPVDLKTALANLAREAERWLAKTPAQNQPQTQGASPNVPPPMRGGPPTAQSPAAPSLPENALPALTAKLLATGSEAALARQTLLQMASLPDANKPAESRWIFDVPLMTPQGAAVAQLIVQRDARGTSTESPEPVWRVGLAVDVEPLGPVRANLALSGGHAWVTIVADRAAALSKLQKDSSWLSDALALVARDVDIAFQSGNGATAPAGRLVNSAS